MRRFFFGLLLLALSFNGCDEDNPVVPQETTPTLSKLTAPRQLYTASTIPRYISVKVNDPQGIEDIAQVTCNVFVPGSDVAMATITLADDGDNGDIIPKDRTYTAPITAESVQNHVGDVTLVFKAVDLANNESDTLQHLLTVIEGEGNEPAVITGVSSPDTFDIKKIFNFYSVTAQVEDQQGLGDVDSVVMQIFSSTDVVPVTKIYLSDDGADGDTVAGDGIYSTSINSSFANEEVGKYVFHFQAFDKSGESSKGIVKIVDVIRNEADNDPPFISEVYAPDTLKLPDTGVRVAVIQATVTDAQGLTDIREVYFNSYKPDGNPSENNPFTMMDTGNISQHGDEFEGDGIYSLKIQLPAGTATGEYRFVFEAIDKSDAKSNNLERILTVVQ